MAGGDGVAGDGDGRAMRSIGGGHGVSSTKALPQLSAGRHRAEAQSSGFAVTRKFQVKWELRTIDSGRASAPRACVGSAVRWGRTVGWPAIARRVIVAIRICAAR